MDSTSADPSPNADRENQTEWDGGRVVLIVGGILYVTCCLPMIRRSESHQIDPGWQIVPWLWLVPCILSAMFDRLHRPTGVYWRIGFSVISALLVALCSQQLQMFDPPLIPTAIAVHVSAASVLEQIIKALRKLAGRLLRGNPISRMAMKGTLVGVICVTATSVPFVWRERVFTESYEAGRSEADNDWKSGMARVRPGTSFYGTRTGDIVIRRMYDPITGLGFGSLRSVLRFDEGYDQRIRELVAEREAPEWSIKSHFILDQDLVALLDSKEMQQIMEFPHQLTDRLRLERNPEGAVPALKISAWHPYFGGPLQVYLRNHEFVFVGKLDKYPDILFIRLSNHSLYALHLRGTYLAEAVHALRIEERDQQDTDRNGGR